MGLQERLSLKHHIQLAALLTVPTLVQLPCGVGRCVGMTSDVIRTFDTITDLHEVLTEIRGEPAVNRTTTCKQCFGFWF
jgi:hypothetical protein